LFDLSSTRQHYFLLSEQINHQLSKQSPAISIFLSAQISTNETSRHQPTATQAQLKMQHCAVAHQSFLCKCGTLLANPALFMRMRTYRTMTRLHAFKIIAEAKCDYPTL
jgi:aspartate/glutamate racemase